MIARIRTKLNVPRSPRGYWAKKANGHKMGRKPRLLKATGDHLLEWRVGDRPILQTQRKPTLQASEVSQKKRPEKEHRMIKAVRIALRGEK